MSFFSKIGHFFAAIGHGIAAAFVKLFGSAAAQAFVNAAKGILESPIGVLAWDAVTYVETLALPSDAAKRAAAFDKILADAKVQGIEVENSLVNLLIELAVNAIKGKFTAA